MNRPQFFGFLTSKVVILILVLLVVTILAVSIPLIWSLLSATRFPTPIQTDSLGVVNALQVVVAQLMISKAWWSFLSLLLLMT